IPNREVKPLMADGTAPQCGRVGSCHIYLKKPFELVFKRLFCFIAIPSAECKMQYLNGNRDYSTLIKPVLQSVSRLVGIAFFFLIC
ncbi:MAG TPA: hypothetical protein VF008_04310, partial [Niastella sp.]